MGVLMAPVVPGLTDDPLAMEAVVRSAATHGACFVGGRVLELKEGTKEHFLGWLASDAPGLLERYAMLYPRAHAPRERAAATQRTIAELCAAYGVARRERRGWMTARASYRWLSGREPGFQVYFDSRSSGCGAVR